MRFDVWSCPLLGSPLCHILRDRASWIGSSHYFNLRKSGILWSGMTDEGMREWTIEKQEAALSRRGETVLVL